MIPVFLSMVFVFPAVAGKRKVRNAVLEAVGNSVQESLVLSPKDREVCFSPDMRCDLKLLKFIGEAKHSIDVAIFDLNLDEFVHQLLLASKHLQVRVVVDRRQSKGPHSLVSTLIRGGVRVRYGRQRGIMHDKFTLVDGSRLETGSFNYTNHASRANQENQIYLDDPGVVDQYRKRFEMIWAGASGADS